MQPLNDGLFGGRYDVSKASFAAALLLAPTYGVLPRRLRARVRRRPAAGCRPARDVPGPPPRGALPRRDDDCDAALPVPAPGLRADHARGVLGHRPGAAARRRRSRRADPRGPPDLPARRPDAGRGSRRVVRAGRGRAGAAGRDPRPARRCRDDVVDRVHAVVLRDSIAYALGQPGRDPGHHPPSTPRRWTRP